jgi:HSP20 family protein
MEDAEGKHPGTAQRQNQAICLGVETMAKVNVEQQTSVKNKEQSSQALSRQEGRRGMARHNEAFPFFSRPSDLFTMNPFAMMRRLTDEMDRAFYAFGGQELDAWSPAIDVREHEGNLVVHADLPGLNKDDVKLDVTEDALVIQGERKREHEEQQGGHYRSERSYGSFYRSIPLPEGANVEQAKANFDNGVLEISIPIPEGKRKSRSIPIESASPERKQAGSEKPGPAQESKAS